MKFHMQKEKNVAWIISNFKLDFSKFYFQINF